MNPPSVLLRVFSCRKVGPTPFDGQYVRDWSPSKGIVRPDGGVNPWLVITPDPAEARRFTHEELRTVAASLPMFEFTAIA